MAMTGKERSKVERESNSSGASWPYLLGIFLLVSIAYGGTLLFPFHFDDWYWIVDKPWSEALWPIGGHANRPVLTTTFTLNNLVFGMEPWSFRLTNILIHIGGAWLLFAITWRSLRLPSLGERELVSAKRFGFAVAAIWALHPIQTMAVTYIWQRSESMMGMFFLVSLYCLLRMATGERKVLWGVGLLVACILGIATKPVMGAVFPVLFVFDWILLSPSFREMLRERKWLYGSFVLLGLTGGSMLLGSTTTSIDNVSSWQYACSQPGAILDYLALTFWPHPLCFDYGQGPTFDKGVIAWTSAVLGILVVGVLVGLRKRSWIGMVGAAFFLILAPSSSFVVINDIKVEYRMYLSVAAVVIFVVAGAGSWLSRRNIRTAPVLGVVLAALLFLTVQRNQDYRTNIVLWESTMAVVPSNGLVQYQLSTALLREGRYEDALPYARRAVELRPGHARGQRNLGHILELMGDKEAGLARLEKMLETNPRAKIHLKCGELSLFLKRPRNAYEHFREARMGGMVGARTFIGIAQAQQQMGHLVKARAACRRALKVETQNAGYWKLMGLIRTDLRDYPAAIKAFERALGLDPDERGLFFRLGQLNAAIQRWDEALRYFEKALEEDPAAASTVAQLAQAVVASPTEAERVTGIRLAELAVRSTRRKDAEILAGLARVQAVLGKRAEALATYAEVLALPSVARNSSQRQQYERERDGL